MKRITFQVPLYFLLSLIASSVQMPTAYSLVLADEPAPQVQSTQSNQRKNQRDKKISGTFIQYQGWVMQMNEQAWFKELDLMKKVGIDTIVIQWLKADQNRFFPVHATGNDPTESILKYADAHQMKIFVGTYFDRAWWSKWDDEEFLVGNFKKNSQFARDIWKRYGKHSSFVGWYIPYEMSDVDFDEHEIKSFQNYLKNTSYSLKKLSSRKHLVAASVFFGGKLSSEAVQKIYTHILKNTNLDILMIQDGVGAHNWAHPIDEKVAPYFKAFKNAGESISAQIWAISESFASVADSYGTNLGRTPADSERLKEQVTAESPYVEKVLTFDFFHYMSPFRGSSQSKLLRGYFGEGVVGALPFVEIKK